MITLPEGITVSRSLADEARVTGLVRQWIEKGGETRKPGIHASDVLDPRLAYWKRVAPKPLDDRSVWMFAAGRAMHAIVLASWGGEEGESDQGSTWSEVLGLWYSPDLRLPELTEFKTTRSFFEKGTIEDISFYLEQLLVYMAAEGKREAWIKVLYLNLKDESGATVPSIRCYRVKVTQGELDGVAARIATTSAEIVRAVEKQDPSALPLCRTWLCGTTCAWWTKCQPEGRFPLRTKKSWKA